MKMLIPILALGLLLTALGTWGFVSAGTPIGDVNGDGVANSIDAALILQYDAGLLDRLGAPATPTATPLSGGLSREVPMPRGQALVVPEGWEFTVLDVNGDAWPVIEAENQFNEPPEPGFRMVMIQLRAENISAAEPASLFGGDFRLVGSADIGYSTFERSCGVTPDGLDSAASDVFRGGTVEGNICFQAGIEEHGLILYTDFFSLDSDARRWFAVE